MVVRAIGWAPGNAAARIKDFQGQEQKASTSLKSLHKKQGAEDACVLPYLTGKGASAGGSIGVFWALPPPPAPRFWA